MYSPKIYESQIPCLYHTAKNLEVPMTQLANAFVYYGLVSGYFGTEATDLIPKPNEVLPENVFPRLQIFNPQFSSIKDYMNSLPVEGTLNPYFQTLEKAKPSIEDIRREVKNDPVPF